MKIGVFEEEIVREAALQQFPSHYIECVTSDLYVKEMENGIYESELIDGTLFISTNYAYQKELVQGNFTNVKVKLTCILVKDDKYQIIYDSKSCYYAVVQKEEEFVFLPYDTFLEVVSKSMKKIEENVMEV